MTLYDENGQLFRPHPSALALGSFWAFGAMIGALLTSLTTALLELALARAAGWTGVWFLYAPFASDPSANLFPAVPLGPLYQWIDLIVFVTCLAIALVSIFFWPTEQRFSSRFFAHVLAFSFGTYGAAARALEEDTFQRLRETLQFDPRVTLAIVVALALIAFIVLMRIERKTIELLSNLYPTETPGQRLIRWAIRMPLPLTALGALFWFNGDRAGTYASALSLFATLLDNIARVPSHRFEQIKDPYLREAAATIPIFALLLVGASVYLFGLEAAGREQRALVWRSDGRVQLVGLGPLRKSYGSDKRLEQKDPGAPPEPPKIEMRWSNRKKG